MSYAIVPGVLNATEVSELRAKMDASGGPDSQYEVKNWCFNKHLPVEFHRDPFFLRYVDRPGVVDIVEAIHGPDCHATGGTLWITGAGRNMGIHLDYQPLGMPWGISGRPARSHSHLFIDRALLPRRYGRRSSVPRC